MTARTILSHLLLAALAFALGWGLSGGPSGNVDRSGLEGSMVVAPGEDPSTAFAQILLIEDPRRRADALVDFFDATDPKWAQLLHESVTDPEAGIVLDEIAELLFASWWAQADAPNAFGHIIDPPYGNRHPWVRAVLREWTLQDPAGAALAVNSLPPGPYRGRLDGARTVLDGWFKTEHEADYVPLLAILSELDGKQRGLATQRVLDSLVEERGIDAAEAFVTNVPDNLESISFNLKQELMARMGVALLDEDVDRAVAWAETHAEGPRGVGIRRHLAYYWGKRDGPAAMEWAISLPETNDRPAVVKRAFMSFGRKHKEEARAWIAARKPTPVLQQVYSRYLTAIAKEGEAERALELAERATDPEVRERVLIAVGKGWMIQDPEGMQAWLEESDFDPEFEARILDAAQRAAQAHSRAAEKQG